MAAISNLAGCGVGAAIFVEKRYLKLGSVSAGFNSRISWPSKTKFAVCHLGKGGKKLGVHMALVNNRLAQSGNVAFDLVQGALLSLVHSLISNKMTYIRFIKDIVKWSSVMEKSLPEPQTAVFLHGILGSRKYLGICFQNIHQEIGTGISNMEVIILCVLSLINTGACCYLFLLVDLRCHGDSASIKKTGPNTVSSTALDVLKLVRQLRITPRVLVGHSFGGKVALSMVEQAAKPFARPVKVWVLDATPGKVRPGGDGEDHPAELISVLKTLPKEVSSKRDVVQALIRKGFSKDVAQWVVTNLRPSGPLGSRPSTFSWMFDLNGISEMYQSYEEKNLWKIVEDVPRGVHVNFLKAERSLHRWALEDLQRIHAAEELAVEEAGGVEMHLEDAGHWVLTDNPDGLFRILTSSFQ